MLIQFYIFQFKFDLVVDGANVNYKQYGVHLHNQTFLRDRNLYQTVKYFDDLQWKVLVIHKGEFRRENKFYTDIINLP